MWCATTLATLMLALVRYSGIFQILISFYSTLIRECDCSSNVTSITPKPTFDCEEVQGVVCKKDADCGKRGSCTGTFNVHRNTLKYVDSIYLPELQIKQTKKIGWGFSLEIIFNLVPSHCALWNHKWNESINEIYFLWIVQYLSEKVDAVRRHFVYTLVVFSWNL